MTTKKGPYASEFDFSEWMHDMFDQKGGRCGGEWHKEWGNYEGFQEKAETFQEQLWKLKRAQLAAARDFLDGMIDMMDSKTNKP